MATKRSGAAYARSIIRPTKPQGTIKGKGLQAHNLLEKRQKEYHDSTDKTNTIPIMDGDDSLMVINGDLLFRDERAGKSRSSAYHATTQMEEIFSSFAGIYTEPYVNSLEMMQSFPFAGVALTEDTPHRKGTARLGVTMIKRGSVTVKNGYKHRIHAGQRLMPQIPIPSKQEVSNFPLGNRYQTHMGTQKGTAHAILVPVDEDALKLRNLVATAILSEKRAVWTKNAVDMQQKLAEHVRSQSKPLEIIGVRTVAALRGIVASALAKLANAGHITINDPSLPVTALPLAGRQAAVRNAAILTGLVPTQAGTQEDANSTAAKATFDGLIGKNFSAPGAPSDDIDEIVKLPQTQLSQLARRMMADGFSELVQAMQDASDYRDQASRIVALTPAAPGGEMIIGIGM